MDALHDDKKFVRFPDWKTLLWLTLTAYVLSDLMWVFADGWRLLIDYYANFSVAMWAEDLGLSMLFTLLSVTYSWAVLRLVPTSKLQLAGLTLSTALLFVVNIVAAWGCSLAIDWLHGVTTSEVDLLKNVFSSAMTSAFISCIYFNLQYVRVNMEAMRRNAMLEKAVASEREAKLQSQLNVLKMQVSPHFMFNNFSILAELIHEDTDTAERFLENLSEVYRYVIQNAERTLIDIAEEMHFLDAYLSLIRLRYEDTVVIDVDPTVASIQGQIPPASLQLLVENAIKHNKRSASEPLHIHIYIDGDCIVVDNDLRPVKAATSTHMGQRNIIKRYEMLHAPQPTVDTTGGKYTVKLPIINPSRQ